MAFLRIFPRRLSILNNPSTWPSSCQSIVTIPLRRDTAINTATYKTIYAPSIGLKQSAVSLP